jgi:non-ribosomal peptide synthetase-like protein
MAERVDQIQLLTARGSELVYLDQAAPLIEEQNSRRLIAAERGVLDNQLAYIIYTPHADGQLRGVAVDHASICNFVKVAAEVFGIRPRDRVYQSLTLAYDFSIQETWVPWFCGATLVPKPAGANLVGQDLHQFLTKRRVTALCTVPSQLATLEHELPALRFLLVSGEACPPELVARWHKPGRRFLNAYGPTEATVTTTWTELRPGKPMTLGVPLPTYNTVILDVADPYHALPHGQTGEIGIAGIGLARCYLNRDDLTDQAFIPDFLGIPGNPSGRIYRTGDLGKVTVDGEIEYHGRMDPSTRERGYRTELAEIESALLRVPGIAQALSDLVGAPAAPGGQAALPPGIEGELAAVLAEVLGVQQVSVDGHFFSDLGADSMVMARFCARARKHPDLPSVSMKDVYAYSTIRSLATALAGPAPAAVALAAPVTAPAEGELAAVLAEVLGVERVSVDGHFFDDLGADSMVMARFCARARKHPNLPSVSMKDVYAYSTIRSLAAAFATPVPASTQVAARPARPLTQPPMPSTEVAEHAARGGARPQAPIGKPRYLLCGTLQMLFLAGYAYLTALVSIRGVEWIGASVGIRDIYIRSAVVTAGTFLGLALLPILAKWLLIGRWKPQQIRIWSLAYFRFWLVKTLVQLNPLVLFVGSPIYTLYLKALGAKIGRGVVIFSPRVPVCTDLLSIGDGSIIRNDSYFNCYRAHDGLIQTGPVNLGKHVFIGEWTVLDIGTAMGDGAQLGHTSSLHLGQAVPAGEHWHGSPAQRTKVNYRAAEPIRCGRMRRAVYATFQLLLPLLVFLPVTIGGGILLLAKIPQIPALLGAGPLAFTGWKFYVEALVGSFVLFFGGLIGGLFVAFTVPRLLRFAIKPDTVYCLYGVRYWVHRVIRRLTNVKLFTYIFGDSSYIVHYLQGLGYKLAPVVQTGSNFATGVKHETPFMTTVGRETVIADGLSIVNADFSNTSFRVSRVSIGASNFFGNYIAYPSQGKTGDNCLLATKVMVPIDGEVRENVGLLGSPCFEIPRSVSRDTRYDHLTTGDELRRRLAAKNRHNLVTIGMFLMARWMHLFVVLMISLVAADLYRSFGPPVIALANVLIILFTPVYFAVVEVAGRGFRPLHPTYCSIYETAFWRQERFFKLTAQVPPMFNGTAFKNTLSRIMGVRVGKRVFDDGCGMSEKNLVTFGDDVTLNAGSVAQCHSQEDYAFKSDSITIGAGCTIGVGALVHYAVTIGKGAVLEADSFLMKGEEIPDGERWGGNPASWIRNPAPVLQAASRPGTPSWLVPR